MNRKDMIIGSRVTGGSAEKFETGDWRSLTPTIDTDSCISCMTCWIYCPDDCIVVEDGKVTGIKLAYCKGCGICAKMCPKSVISME
ncbi:MAG: 4Fe-4S binding protein [archaeon]|nr:4Fe-4S binding protein [archaeon]